MRKKTFISIYGFLTVFISPIFIIDGSIAKDLKKVTSPIIKRHAQTMDANQIAMTIMNNGTFARNPETGNSAFYYPNGTEKTAIYAAGLWIAGKVNGEIRTACADYNTEYQPGVILPDGIPDNPDLEKYRIYKIKPGDSADPNNQNYNKDYADWPIQDGAPVDENGLPLIIGDQTLWCVMNDGDRNIHASCYNTPPLNLEVQLLSWAFDDNTTPLGKTVVLHYTIINKNSSPITEAYIGVYVDPDLGYVNDDGSACDTTLNLTYVYNRNNVDKVYGAAVPAVGIYLLQGPVIPSIGDVAFQFMQDPIENAKNLNITSNTVYY